MIAPKIVGTARKLPRFVQTCLASVVALTASAQEPPPPAGITLKFGWPAEGNVRVTEETQKKGNDAVSTYVLRWAPAEEGGTLLEYTDFKFVSLRGVNATTPVARSAFRQAEAFASAIPKLHLDSEGYVQAFVGFDEMIDRVLDEFAAELDESFKKSLAKTLRQPQVRQMMDSKMAETWGAWVANWIDLEVVRGTEEVWELDVEITGGATREMTVTYGELTTHRGVECVEITTEGVADEALLLRRTLEFMGLIAAGLGEDELPDDLPVTRMTRRDTTRGIYTVDGLRPIEVHTSQEIHIWETGADEPQEQIERHTYSFDWGDLEPADGKAETSK